MFNPSDVPFIQGDSYLEDAFFHIFDNKVALVEKKSDYKVIKKKESSQTEEDKSSEISFTHLD